MQVPKHHVVYLSYDGLTDPLGQSQILPYLVGLSTHEFRFTIISFEKSNAFLALQAKVKNICAEHNIDWIPLTYHKDPPVLSTLYDLRKLKQVLKELYQRDPFLIIHCRSYLTSLIALPFKKRYKVKVIFDMRGFWADERVEGKLWNLRNPLFNVIYKYFKKKERDFLMQADHTISLTQNARKTLENEFKGIAPITVIPTCADLRHFDPGAVIASQAESLRKDLNLEPNDFVVLYLGSWGTWYLTEEMLDFFSATRKVHLNAKFLIVTPDQVDLTNYPHASNVIIRKATREDVPLFISIATVALFFIKTSFSKKASAATKMGELMAMGKPIISNRGWGDVEEYLSSNALVDQFTEKEFFRVLKEAPMQDDFRSVAAKHFALQAGVESYLMVYRSLL
jgi:glycosyltransferase involved in cell wall biosynthesis